MYLELHLLKRYAQRYLDIQAAQRQSWSGLHCRDGDS